MSTTVTYQCDCGCKAEKKESNHWFNDKRSFSVYPWDEYLARDRECLLASGENCVHKLLSQWFKPSHDQAMETYI